MYIPDDSSSTRLALSLQEPVPKRKPIRAARALFRNGDDARKTAPLSAACALAFLARRPTRVFSPSGNLYSKRVIIVSAELVALLAQLLQSEEKRIEASARPPASRVLGQTFVRSRPVVLSRPRSKVDFVAARRTLAAYISRARECRARGTREDFFRTRDFFSFRAQGVLFLSRAQAALRCDWLLKCEATRALRLALQTLFDCNERLRARRPLRTTRLVSRKQPHISLSLYRLALFLFQVFVTHETSPSCAF